MSTSLMINNASRGTQWVDNQLTSYLTIDIQNPTSNAVAQLNIGDTVYVKVVRKSISAYLRYDSATTGSSFSGFMTS